jgi:membrane protease YdiL (CAAX protease family)
MRAICLPVLKALFVFMLSMGICQGLVGWNASLSPEIPWFPLPAALVVWAVTAWSNQRWPLRLGKPPQSLGSAYTFSLLLTAAILCLAVLENAYHELVIPAPLWPDESVSVSFQRVYMIVLPLIAAVLAEVAFRGIMQTGLEPVLPLWPMLVLIAVLNMLMHFYDPHQFAQAFRLISLNLAWGYVTWRSMSLRPAMAGHVAMNLAVLGIQYRAEHYGSGPIDYGALPASALAFWLITGLGLCAIAAYLARYLPKRNA